ncbi:cytochrome c [bacterium]|nr:cytochrome c [bacterium]
MRILNPIRSAAIAFFCLPLAASALAADATDSGKALHDKHCSACHVRLFGGDGNKVYTRSPRLIGNPAALKQRVAACSAQTGAKLFPDEEEKIAAYLTQQFYKFK